MSRLSNKDLRRIDELTESLKTWREGGPPALGEFLPRLCETLDCAGVVHGIDGDATGYRVSDFQTFRLGASVRQQVNGGLAKGRRWWAFDPRRPDAKQGNRALSFQALQRVKGEKAVNEDGRWLFRQIGFEPEGQTRILLCDGPRLLAFLAVLSGEQSGPREVAFLQRLQPALSGRLNAEGLLSTATLNASALHVALEAIPGAAFLIDARGRILLVNAVGRTLLDEDSDETARVLAHVAAGHPHAGVTVQIFDAPGLGTHRLVVWARPTQDPLPRLALARQRWGLTPRQAEVLGLLARGLPNKLIAADLGCAEHTVELHVSALLARTESDSRAELVARFWTET